MKPPQGTGDPGNFASKTPANNISMLLIQQINSVLPSHFNGMIVSLAGCYEYQQTATEDMPNPTIITVEAAMDDPTTNASPMAFLGCFTGGGAAKAPYLIAPAYAALLAVLKTGDQGQLQSWYQLYFPGQLANWQNFLNGMGVGSAVIKAIQSAIEAAAQGLPALP